MSALTAENDMTARGLRAQLARVAEMDEDELFQTRDDAANGFMLYTVKPLHPHSDRRPNAVAIREQRACLYRELWLACWGEGLNR